jgi:hypothetical protein
MLIITTAVRSPLYDVPVPSSTRPSIKVTKSFSFRGSARLWSNRYYMSGPTPADSTHWTTFSDAVVNLEKAMLSTAVAIVATHGYAPGSDVPVFSKTYATAGQLNPALGIPQAGEVAALVRYSTAGRTSKNHPLYLFNYYHGVAADAATTPDLLKTGWVTSYNTYAAAWVAGISDGTNLQVRCGPQGNVATGYLTETWLTHRDFPRA